jgi:L-alanine-DL-glutamate epimerase-like enolase superfamily enzyme
MKITKLTTFVVPPRWLFLKIETDAGVTGWGEPIVEGRAATVAALVAEMADYLVGKDPGAIEDHWTVLYRGGFYRGGAIHMSALAACLQLDAICANAVIQEQSLGIHYNQPNDLLAYVANPSVFACADGHVAIPGGPGLGIEIHEEAVARGAVQGHRWRPPVWRHEDGSFAEW